MPNKDGTRFHKAKRRVCPCTQPRGDLNIESLRSTRVQDLLEEEGGGRREEEEEVYQLAAKPWALA